MKKILLSIMCLVMLTGCEKTIEVVSTTGGFDVEKVASIPGREESQDSIGLGIYLCEKDAVCVAKENYETGEKIIHQLNLNDYSVKEIEHDGIDELNQYFSYNFEKNENELINQTIFEISDTEKIIASEAIMFDDNGEEVQSKKTYTYQNEHESKLVAEMDSTIDILINDGMSIRKDRSVIITYYDDQDCVIIHIQSGGKITELVREPLVRDGMKLLYPSFDDEKLSLLNLLYVNDTKQRVYYKDQSFDFNLNEHPMRVSDDLVIIQEEDEKKEVIVKTSLYHLKTKEKRECTEPLNGYFYRSLDQEKGHFLFVPNDELESETKGYYTLVQIGEDQIELTELPFENDQYTTIPLDDGSYLFFTNGMSDENIDCYRLTIANQ